MQYMTNEQNIFSNMPEHYLLCYHTECERASTCLHWLAGQHGNTADVIVQTVNPKLNGGPACRYHKPLTTVRMAYGMKHSFDHVLAVHIASLRKAITSHFGNGSYYLRRNGRRPITPEEQEFVRSLFRKYGYPDDALFDRYADEVEW